MRVIAIVAAGALGVGLYFLHAFALVATGYKAKTLCSAVFVSGRPPEAVLAEDLSVDGYENMALLAHEVDREQRSVTSSFFGLVGQQAIFRKGLGCTLAIGRSIASLQREAPQFPDLAAAPDAPWPSGESADSGSQRPTIDGKALESALDAAFAERNPDALQRTRAVVVVHGGRIAAERYARGFDAKTPILGWSMTKSAFNALIGIRVRQAKLALDARGLLPEWRNDEDTRSRITLDQLLRMSSGLPFSENYADRLSDVATMLFATGDTAGFAATRDAARQPGADWHYSSGTSNIVARVLRSSFSAPAHYLTFPHRELFSRLGMASAVLEPDASGTFVASSFMYATARDWARLGLFYLRDGVWQGDRILPEGWVTASLRPTRAEGGSKYGAHIWLKLPKSTNGGEPPLPDDAYYMLGHEGQAVAIVPSRDLVIVRLGLARKPGAWKPALVLAPIVRAFPQRPEYGQGSRQ